MNVALLQDFGNEPRNNILQFPCSLEEDGKRYATIAPILEHGKQIKSADPLKTLDEIDAVVLNLLHNGKWRDAMLCVLGFNIGARISDLLKYRVSDIEGRDSLIIKEQKTNHFREVRYNQAVQAMLALYREKCPQLTPDSFLFAGHSNNKVYCRSGESETALCITRQAANTIVKNAVASVGIAGQFSTHSLRQTYAYHVEALFARRQDMAQTLNAMQALQSVLRHSSITSTQHYSRFVHDAMLQAYDELNLGLGAILQFRKEG